MLLVRNLVFIVIACLCNFQSGNGLIKRQFLHESWKAKGSALDRIIDLPATVPGGIFSDLMKNNAIKDIFYGYGNTNYSWVGLTDWTYSSNFSVDQELLNHKAINLVFEGLDTFATISINGKDVGKSENMFVRYIINISALLKLGLNRIDVKFESAVNAAENLRIQQDKSYVVPPKCPYENANGICNPNQIRKMQASFGWDWGPAFSSVGIWKPVYLESFDSSSIADIISTATKTASGWSLEVTTYFNSAKNVETLDFLNVSLLSDSGTILSAQPVKLVHNNFSETLATVTLNIPESSVKLWWPNGYGSQNLYNLTVQSVSGTDQDTKTVKIGFRTVELIQEPIPGSTGLSFYFKVNGIAIFARGANQIPINVLPERGQNKTVVEHLLKSVRDVNMNMLRVWGGGVYESDYFYQLADEYGILIWQDFMFACSLYPARPDYLKSVSQEVNNQVKRLSSHPSIAVWAGNNENEVAFVQGWYDTGSNSARYAEDYVKLYVGTIKKEVLRLLPNAIYVVSSPSNGKASETNGYFADNPQDELYGDVHYYDYNDDGWDYKVFPTPRFASEYGYQSMPSYDSWLGAIDNPSKNLDPQSDFMQYRQHHLNGNNENVNLVNSQFVLPNTTDPTYIKTFIYFTQIIQAQAIKTETEHYRSFKGRIGADKKGFTMGALYWQLNDVWVAPTWSSIDYTGKWKMLHYFAKNFYANSIIVPKLDENNMLRVYTVTDDQVKKNHVVDMHIYKWNSFEAFNLSYNAIFDPLKAIEVTSINAEHVLLMAGCGGNTFDEARKKCFFVFRVQNESNFTPVNYLFPAKLRDSEIPNAVVKIESVTAVNGSRSKFEIKLSSSTIALFVWLDSHQIPGLFSENGFLQLTPEKIVTFTSESDVSATDLKNALTVVHLREPSSFIPIHNGSVQSQVVSFIRLVISGLMLKFCLS